MGHHLQSRLSVASDFLYWLVRSPGLIENSFLKSRITSKFYLDVSKSMPAHVQLVTSLRFQHRHSQIEASKGREMGSVGEKSGVYSRKKI